RTSPVEAVLFDGDQTLWDFQRVMQGALMAVLDELRAARPGAVTDALTVGDLQRDQASVAQELLRVEYTLARLRRLGFARSLQRVRRDGGVSSEAQDLVVAEQLADS